MSKILNLKPVYNKKNGQINISLPKRKLPKNLKKTRPKFINISIESWF